MSWGDESSGGWSDCAWGASADAEASPSASPFPRDDGRYLRGGRLGRGGMGEVLSAEDLRLGRTVAMKVIGEGEDPERLAREARITGRLDHPSIVPVHDAGTGPDGRAFYTMRLVRGRTLGQAARQLPHARRLGLVRHVLDACEAVAFAHDAGIIHRDLKAENVLVGDFGETQVVDWGLACAIDEADDIGVTRPSGGPMQTVWGQVLGTPATMAPEQARGQPADARSDVWGLGTLLFEVLAGEPIATGSDPVELIARRSADEDVRVSGRLDAPMELVAIATKALEVDPARRYADAGAMAQDLASFLDGRLVEAHRYTPIDHLRRVVWVWRAPLAVAVVAATLLAVGAGWSWQRTAAERDRALEAEGVALRARDEADRVAAEALVVQATEALRKGDRATSEALAARALARHDGPDVRGVLAAWALSPRPRRVGSWPLPTCEGRWALGPRGERAVCAGRKAAWVLDVATGRTVGRIDDEWALAQVGHGHLFAQTPTVELRVLELGGDEVRPVRGVRALGDVLTSPDADWAFLVDPRAAWVVHLGDATARQLRPVCGETPLAGGLSPDGRRGALVCGDGRVFDVALPDGEPVERGTVADAVRVVDIDDAGRVVVATGAGAVQVLPAVPEAPWPAPLLVSREGLIGLELGASGELLARVDRRGTAVVDLDTVRVVAELPAVQVRRIAGELRGLDGDRVVAWESPDSTPVSFSSLHGLSAAAISPDGATVAAVSGGGEVLWWSTADGRVLHRLDRGPRVAKDLDWSPGGRLAWASLSSPQVEWSGAPGGEVVGFAGTDLFRRVVWLGDDAVVAASYGAGLAVRTTSGEVRNLEPLEGETVFDLDGSPDGSSAVATTSTGRVFRISAAGQVDPLEPPIRAGKASLGLDGAVALLVGDKVVLRRPDGSERRWTLPSAPLDVELGPRGRWLAAGRLDGCVSVWDLSSEGRLALVSCPHAERVASVRFGRKGRRLVTGAWDGTARLIDLSVVDRPRDELWAEVSRQSAAPEEVAEPAGG